MDYYDDPDFSYPSFWGGREYEHESELLALQRLLGDKRFDHAADIGGGFGRLVGPLSRYARNITLIEPSVVQRKLATTFASKNIVIQEGDSEDTGLSNKSCDLVVMVRVMHHLPHPENSMFEMWRILKPGGLFVLEFANSLNFKSRLRHVLHFRSMSLTPIDISTSLGERIPFVNHHPRTVKRFLRREGFIILNEISVSNFRSPFLKKILSVKTLLFLERLFQRPLSWISFGPSIFILAKRPDGLKEKGLGRHT